MSHTFMIASCWYT